MPARAKRELNKERHIETPRRKKRKDDKDEKKSIQRRRQRRRERGHKSPKPIPCAPLIYVCVRAALMWSHRSLVAD